MSGRRLHLEVTWPVCRRVGPIPGSNQLAALLCCKARELRRDLVRITDEGVYIRGLFGFENRVPDVDRYEIVKAEVASLGRLQAERTVAVRQHRVANATPSSGAACANQRPLLSTYPYVDQPVATTSVGRTLVIVLESPHRDEYGKSVQAPLAPARGSTGARIHRYLCTVVNSCPQIRRTLFNHAPVRVVISNPIPFQTSAYAIHGGALDVSDRLRNFIWRALWRDSSLGLQSVFGGKLGSYAAIVAIVNACTVGGDPSRRAEVTTLIRASRPRVPLYETDHPSTWKSGTTLKQVP